MWNPGKCLVAAAMGLVMCAPAVAAAGPAAVDLVRASVVADVAAVAPGGTFTLGVWLKIKPHWHVYWVNPGDSGEATRVTMSGPAGVEFGETRFPLPRTFSAVGSVSYGYEDEVLVMVPVKAGNNLAVGTDLTLRADVNWLSCSDTCILGRATLAITLPVRGEATPANRELFETWRKRLPVTRKEAAEVLAEVRQGSTEPELDVRWKVAPAKVEWYPVSTRAVAIEEVVVAQEGLRTRIGFKPTVYQADRVPEGRVESVLVFEDARGERRGVVVPFKVGVRK